jgi:MioC protein
MNLKQMARVFTSFLPSPKEDKNGVRTHDYTKRGPGHDYTLDPIDGGKRISISGWGHGIRNGDYIILPNGEGTTRYRFIEISYYADPRDMWHGRAAFAPRKR